MLHVKHARVPLAVFHVQHARVPQVHRLAAVLLILVSALVGSAAPLSTGAAATIPRLAPGTSPSNSPAFVPGVLLVKPRLGTAATALTAQRGVHRIDRTILPTGVARIIVDRGQEQTVAARLQARGLVQYAQLDYRRHITDVTPNDPLYAEDQWDLPLIGMPTAWSTTEGTASTIVAVIDTGYDFGHPDQPVHLMQGPVYSSLASMDGCGTEGPVPMDDYGHGTHVTGTIAAAFNNDQGVAGMAPNVTIMVIKAADCVGNLADSDIISAITYAVEHGARVINMSFGGPGADPALTDATAYAWGRGLVLVAAAGNDGRNELFLPADAPHVLAVAATNGADQPTWYSNWGGSISVAAPGGDPSADPGIWSTCIDLSTSPPESTYCRMFGTSMASPHVAAEAALLLSVAPELTNAQVSAIVKSAVDPIQSVPPCEFFGTGRINVSAALNTVTSATRSGAATVVGRLVSPSAATTSIPSCRQYLPLIPNGARLAR